MQVNGGKIVQTHEL